jgi:predicted NUDIX family NTP pyrophosphohydrolase
MSVNSAGILLFRLRGGGIEGSVPQVLLVHPGGPFWAKKDEGAWSIPKGVCEEGESPLKAARRELFEETGYRPECEDSEFIDLGAIRQPSGKMVHVWAMLCREDCSRYNWEDAAEKSNKFSMEWPSRSGVVRQFPEVDRAEWFDLLAARERILKGQAGFLDRLERIVQKG